MSHWTELVGRMGHSPAVPGSAPQRVFGSGAMIWLRSTRPGVGGVWLTAKPLTTLETAVAVPDGSVFLDRALQRHLGFSAVYRAYCRNLGTRGGADIAVLPERGSDRPARCRGSAMIVSWVRQRSYLAASAPNW